MEADVTFSYLIARAAHGALALLPTDTQPLSGVDRYTDFELVAETNMSLVYRATDDQDGGDVCVKVLHPRLLGDDQAERRFRKEAKLLQEIDHPNVVRSVDAGEDETGTPFLVTEWIEGRTLRQRLLTRGSLTTTELIALALDLCAALEQLHTREHVHKDIKPENVMFREDGSAVLIDVGIATRTDGPRDTRTGSYSGTPGRYGVDIENGARPTGADDIRALGQLFQESATPLGKEYSEKRLPPALAQLLRRMQSPDRTHRPQSATDVTKTLTKIRKRTTMMFRPLLLTLAALCVAVGISVVVAQVITVKTPDGKTHQMNVPPGGTVVVDEKNRVTVEPPDTPPEAAAALAEAVKKGNGRELSLHDARLTDAALLPALKGVTTLRHLDLGECAGLSDGVAAVVEANPDLESLRLGGVPLSPDALRRIAAHLTKSPKREKILSISGEAIPADVAVALTSVPNLVQFSLHGALCDGATCDALAKQDNLRHLRLSGNKSGRATAADYAKLGALTRLTFLDLTYTVAGDETAKALTGLKDLEEMYLSKTDVTTEAAETLAGLKRLRSLTLDDTRFGDDGLPPLKRLPQLGYLSVDKTDVTDTGTAELKNFPALAGLSARFTKIGDGSAANLAAIPKLKAVFLTGTGSGDATLRALRRSEKRLEQVVTGRDATNEGVKELSGISSLTNLSLFESAADDGCIPDLAKLTALQQLDVSRSKITPDGAKRLKQLLPKCRVTSEQ